jgi:hypothetical protein
MPARPGVLGCLSSSFAWISLWICLLPIIGGQPSHATWTTDAKKASSRRPAKSRPRIYAAARSHGSWMDDEWIYSDAQSSHHILSCVPAELDVRWSVTDPSFSLAPSTIDPGIGCVCVFFFSDWSNCSPRRVLSG